MKRIFLYLIIIPLILFSDIISDAKNDGDYVVILHGIARSSSSMSKVAKGLEREGFTVFNIDYPSTKYKISKLAEIANKEISKLAADKNQKIHFVGYSMGSILTRIILDKYRSSYNLGRVVMLAPPNQGSEVTDFVRNNIIYKEIWGPAGQQLGTGADDIASKLGNIDYELGIIAGDRSVDPISSAIIPGKDDGKVAVERTKVEGMKEHVTIHTSHLFIIQNDEAISQTAYFLKNGEFKKEK